MEEKGSTSQSGGTTQHTDIPESEGAESTKLQCPKSHMQIS